MEKIREIATVLFEWVPASEQEDATDEVIDEADHLAPTAAMPHAPVATIHEYPSQEEVEDEEEEKEGNAEGALLNGDGGVATERAEEGVGADEAVPEDADSAAASGCEEGEDGEAVQLPDYEELLPPAPSGEDAAGSGAVSDLAEEVSPTKVPA